MFFLTDWFSDTPTCSTDPAWEWMASRYTKIQNGSPRIEVLRWLHVKWRKHLQLQMAVLICQSNDKRWQLHRWCWVNDRMPSFDLMNVVKSNMATSLCCQHVPGVSSMLQISSGGWIALNTLMKWLDYMHQCIPFILYTHYEIMAHKSIMTQPNEGSFTRHQSQDFVEWLALWRHAALPPLLTQTRAVRRYALTNPRTISIQRDKLTVRTLKKSISQHQLTTIRASSIHPFRGPRSMGTRPNGIGAQTFTTTGGSSSRELETNNYGRG